MEGGNIKVITIEYDDSADYGKILMVCLSQLYNELIRRALAKCKANQVQACKMLGMNRGTFRKYMKGIGL